MKKLFSDIGAHIGRKWLKFRAYRLLWRLQRDYCRAMKAGRDFPDFQKMVELHIAIGIQNQFYRW